MLPSSEIKKYDFCFRNLPTLCTTVRNLEDLKARLPSSRAVSVLLQNSLATSFLPPPPPARACCSQKKDRL